MPSQTTDHNIPFAVGTDPANTIDDTMEALAERVDQLIVAHDAGTLAGRPTSTPGSPGIEGRVYRVNAGVAVGMVNYDTGTSWVTLRDPDPGALASRPAANTVPAGTQYRATDTGDLSRSDGTTWFTLTPGLYASFAISNASQNINDSGLRKVTVFGAASPGSSYFSGSRFTAPLKGRYEFEAALSLDESELLQTRFYKNASIAIGATAYDDPPLNGTGKTDLIRTSVIVDLDATDYVELFAAAPLMGVWIDGTTATSTFAGKLLAQLP